MNKFIKFLKAVKLFDPDNTLSLSNVAMMTVIAKLATTQDLDWTVLTAFFFTLLNHNSRKWFAKEKAQKTVTDQEKLTEMEKAVQAIKTSMALRGK
ncbi:MAG TPA: hypothetical protein V6C65_26175 [Allocoleopsis sp.]